MTILEVKFLRGKTHKSQKLLIKHGEETKGNHWKMKHVFQYAQSGTQEAL